MTVLRTAVVGLGRVGWQYHVPQVVEHEGFELCAVVDPLAERREEARERHGVPGYDMLETALAAEHPELVVIASPTPFHAEQAIAAMEHGCDVFCDKPVAANLAETDAMLAAAVRCRRRLQVYQPHRGFVETLALRDILARDLIGPLVQIRRVAAGYQRRNDWQAQRRHGGGMLNNFGAHYIDQLLHLSDYAAHRITCHTRTVASRGDAEDVVKALIETAGGVLLDVEVNMATPLPLTPWYVQGTCGAAVLDSEAKAWRVRHCAPADLTELDLEESLAAAGRRYGPDDPIAWQETLVPLADYHAWDWYGALYAHVVQDAPPLVPLAETRELMRVLEQCRVDAGVA